MAGQGEGASRACSSCAIETKYICLRCGEHCCNRCSEIENEEETPGWKAGKSVGYCEECSLQMLGKVSESEVNVYSASCHQLEKKIERYESLIISSAVL